MNAVNKPVIIFIASVLCFCIFSSVKTEALNSGIQVSANLPFNENSCFTVSSFVFSIQAISSEDSSDCWNNYFSLGKRTAKTTFSLQEKKCELARINRCSRYILYSTNNIDRFQPADIIYPYQYFW